MARYSKTSFRVVFNTVVHGVFNGNPAGIEEYIRIASLNKVLLHFLRAARVEGEIRLREEARFKLFQARLSEITSALDGLRYVLFKTRKPVVYVPSDIDVLIDRRHVGRAVERLRKLGYRIEVAEPYCVTLTRGSTIVDLYVNPTLASTVYLNGEKLLEYTIEDGVYSVKAPVLSSEAELVVVAAHAVYKERLYTLNDYATLNYLYTPRARELARELKVEAAIREALEIHRLVNSELITTPYRIPLAKWTTLLALKLAGDTQTRATVLNTLKALRDRRFGKLAYSKLTRETY